MPSSSAHPHAAIVRGPTVAGIDRLGVDALANRSGSDRELRRGQGERLRTRGVVEALEGIGVARREGRSKSGSVDGVLLGEASCVEGGPQLRTAVCERTRVRSSCADGLFRQMQAHGDLRDGGAFGEIDAVAPHRAGCASPGVTPGAIECGVGPDPGRRVGSGVIEDRQNEAVFVGGRALSIADDVLQMSQPRIDVGHRCHVAVVRPYDVVPPPGPATIGRIGNARRPLGHASSETGGHGVDRCGQVTRPPFDIATLAMRRPFGSELEVMVARPGHPVALPEHRHRPVPHACATGHARTLSPTSDIEAGAGMPRRTATRGSPSAARTQRACRRRTDPRI